MKAPRVDEVSAPANLDEEVRTPTDDERDQDEKDAQASKDALQAAKDPSAWLHS